LKIGVIQLCSKLEPVHNLKIISDFIKDAVSQNIKYLFLPECFYSMGDGITQTPYLVDPLKKNEHYQEIRSLAVQNKIFLLGGSAASILNGSVVNRAYNFTPNGDELNHYDKINLFSCELGSETRKKIIREADLYTAGSTHSVVVANELKIGLSICFDIRFPLMYQKYRSCGANLVTISSAFTVPSGMAHWHTLVRARAIENQLFVVAPAQWGVHNDKMKTYGHSLIVDPWGEILADAKDGEKLITAEIDFGRIGEVRSAIKMDGV